MKTSAISRRTAFRRISSTAALGAATAELPHIGYTADNQNLYKAASGRIRQSVIYWCFKPMPVEELAQGAARMGMKSVELVTPEYWPMLKKLGLICAMTPSHGFAKGFAHKEEHDECIEILRRVRFQKINELVGLGASECFSSS